MRNEKLVAFPQNFDVVWGDGQTLRANGGDFSEAVEWCLADDTSATDLSFNADPEPGQVFWFLLRCAGPGGGGSYDSDALEQVGLRDPGIGASPASCP